MVLLRNYGVSKRGRTRFDLISRDGTIANIGLEPGIDPLGEVEEVAVGEHLLLFCRSHRTPASALVRGPP